MKELRRWVILKHNEDPKDPTKFHYDLLLEAENHCQAWKLNQIPTLNGPSVKALPGTIHKLSWLEKKEAKVSNNRGHAVRVIRGLFKGELPKNQTNPCFIMLMEGDLEGQMKIHNNFCEIKSE